jgi:hypothetical protein
MTYPQTSISTPLSVPVAGINKRDPLAAMPQGYALEALNFDPEPQYLRLRNGYVRHCDVTSIASSLSFCLGAYNSQDGASKLFLYGVSTGLGHTIWDVTSSVPSVKIGPISSAATDDGGVVSYDGGNRLLFSGTEAAFYTLGDPSVDTFYYNGATNTWAKNNWDASGSGQCQPAHGGTVFKGRVYFYVSRVPGYYYGGLLSVSGATTYQSLASFSGEDCNIRWINTLSSAGNINNELMLCIGLAGGDVLVFGGDSPISSNWQLISRVVTGPSFSGKCAISVLGDIFVPCTNGVFSIRACLSSTTGTLDETTISNTINPHWTTHMRFLKEDSSFSYAQFAEYFKIWTAFWPERNQLYILAGGFLNSDGTYTERDMAATMYVYNLVSKAWTWHKINVDGSSYGARELIYFDNNIYFLIDQVIMKVSDTVYKDETWNSANTFTGYTYNLESAYTALGQVNTKKRVTGVELLVKTDFNGSNVGVKVASDFGRKVSAVSNQSLQSGYNSVNYSVGVDGTFLQYRLTGTSDTASTQGLELYSVGLNLK